MKNIVALIALFHWVFIIVILIMVSMVKTDEERDELRASRQHLTERE